MRERVIVMGTNTRPVDYKCGTRVGACKNMLSDLIHRTVVRLHHHVSRPLVGRLVPKTAYEPIRDGFTPPDITAETLTLDMNHATPIEGSPILSSHGAVVLKNLVAPGLVDAARNEADLLTEQLATALAGPGDHGDRDGIAWQVGSARLRNQHAILAAGQPIANIRSRSRDAINGGVVDFYFIDKAAKQHGWKNLAACCAALQAPDLLELVAAVSRARYAHVNMLRNDSVHVTRGLHVDNLRGSYKIFLYLGDVPTLDDGPFAYVPGSHRRLDLLRREVRLNALTGRSQTDVHSFDGYALPLPVEKGTAIVSCQTGVHRGMPQRAGASRTVVVAHFRT